MAEPGFEPRSFRGPSKYCNQSATQANCVGPIIDEHQLETDMPQNQFSGNISPFCSEMKKYISLNSANFSTFERTDEISFGTERFHGFGVPRRYHCFTIKLFL